MSRPITTCPDCGTKNRVPADASGRPRCASCHHDLPWLTDVGADEFDRVIATSALPALVDLWAPWCGPCRMVAPALEQLSRERAVTLRVVKVKVDEAPSVSEGLGVQGIPTMVLFRDGREIARQVGALPGDAIRRWVDDEVART